MAKCFKSTWASFIDWACSPKGVWLAGLRLVVGFSDAPPKGRGPPCPRQKGFGSKLSSYARRLFFYRKGSP
jgi:hypothetical protein